MNTTNSKKSSLSQTWYLVTNHLNLLYMLAAGLVMGPSGFRGKHYVDSLGAIPGWIPLFRNVIPAKTLDHAVSERKHLRPCVISLDLSGVSAPVQVLSREGEVRDANFPNLRLGKEGIGILVRAPLPLTLFSHIYFHSDGDRQIFETAAKDVSNVDLKPYRLKVEESLFRNEIDVAWPPNLPRRYTRQKKSDRRQRSILEMEKDSPQVSDPPRDHPRISEQALGGLLAMLYHCANRSELGVKVFQLVRTEAQAKDAVSIQDPVLTELPNWLEGGEVSAHSNTPTRLFWGVANALAQEENSLAQPVDMVLAYLDAQLAQLTDETYKSRLERLIADMRGILGLNGGTITDLFERNKGSLSRPLILFCLREHCKDLLEFSHPLLSDAEYLLSGILFGIRDGWIRLPCEMRNQALSAYIMSRMTDVAHKKQGDVFSSPKMPSPQPLRALFPAGGESWHPIHTTVAIEIAKASKWQDCIATIIASADGSPLDEPKQENGKFIFSGETTSTIKIRHEVFLKYLGEWPPIDMELEAKAKNDLNS
jgi:hypothetical protein